MLEKTSGKFGFFRFVLSFLCISLTLYFWNTIPLKLINGNSTIGLIFGIVLGLVSGYYCFKISRRLWKNY